MGNSESGGSDNEGTNGDKALNKRNCKVENENKNLDGKGNEINDHSDSLVLNKEDIGGKGPKVVKVQGKDENVPPPTSK